MPFSTTAKSPIVPTITVDTPDFKIPKELLFK
jgi:hypothetical protein